MLVRLLYSPTLLRANLVLESQKVNCIMHFLLPTIPPVEHPFYTQHHTPTVQYAPSLSSLRPLLAIPELLVTASSLL